MSNNIRILSDADNSPLRELPDRLAGIYQLSLGKQDGIFIINDFVICGKIAANAKSDYERMNIAAYKGDVQAKKRL